MYCLVAANNHLLNPNKTSPLNNFQSTKHAQSQNPESLEPKKEIIMPLDFPPNFLSIMHKTHK